MSRPPAQQPAQIAPLAPQSPAFQHTGPPPTIPGEPPGGWKKAIAWPEKLGLSALVLSFVIRLESYKTVNGEVLHYSNTSATIGGIIAILCGLFSLLLLGSTVPHGKSKRLIAAILLFGIGGYQLAAGQGVFIEGKSGNTSHVGVGSPSQNAVDSFREMDARRQRRMAQLSETMQIQINRCIKNNDTLACERARKAVTPSCPFLPNVCGDIGVLFMTGLGGAVDKGKGFALTEKACTGQDPNSCVNLGILYRDGSGVPQNKDRALEIFEANCTRGFGRACHQIGLLRQKENNQAGAREAFVNACQAKHEFAAGCRFAFDYSSEGVGGPKDIPRALEWGVMACENGEAAACNNMGVILDSGVDIAKDSAQALEYFRLACEGDHGLGCMNYGSIQGRNNPISIPAFKAFERGCSLDLGEGCYYQSVMLSDKRFSEKNPELAIQAAAKACKLGFEKACAPGASPPSPQ